MVGVLCGPDDGIYPALALLPIAEVTVEDVWHTDACGPPAPTTSSSPTRSSRTTASSGWPTSSRTAPGARLHAPSTYRWPMVPALALMAAMPALGSAERVVEIYAERLGERVLAYEGVKQKDKPLARTRLGEAEVRLRALRGLLDDTVGGIEALVCDRETVPLTVRAQARMASGRTSCTNPAR